MRATVGELGGGGAPRASGARGTHEREREDVDWHQVSAKSEMPRCHGTSRSPSAMPLSDLWVAQQARAAAVSIIPLLQTAQITECVHELVRFEHKATVRLSQEWPSFFSLSFTKRVRDDQAPPIRALAAGIPVGHGRRGRW